MASNVRVFISSTSIDLQSYREAAFKAIHSLGGFGDDMVYWSADERSGGQVSVDRVRQSDALILILAHRYGYVPDGSTHSVTEMEYRAARTARIPVLAFVIDDDVPWPPKWVERERATELTRFKEMVGKEVTFGRFHSPDELMALVTQSVVALTARLHEPPERGLFKGHAQRISPAAELRSSPDAVVQVGHAEDGLPLVLKVTRSKDLEALLEPIADAVAFSGAEPPAALFKTFQQSLEQYFRQEWVRERVFSVADNGRVRNMYVTRSTLSSLFRPLFDAILDGERPRDTVPKTVVPGFADTPISTVGGGGSRPAKELQSVGGQNRFLGLSLDDDTVWSVGLQAGRWVQWRRFFYESLPAYFPDGTFELRFENRQPIGGNLADYLHVLSDTAARMAADDGSVNLYPNFIVSRQSAAKIILAIGESIEAIHEAGRIHGDLKPNNVVLTQDRPTLIDDFELEEGNVAPGWTPDWSSPEQVLGNPVSRSTDIYPLGVMIARVIGGRLVGEVRKFRTVPLADGRDEFDIYYNPFIHLDSDQTILNAKGLREWLAFARSCLLFEPEKRIDSSLRFVVEFRALLEEHPLQGDLRVNLPGRLVMGRIPDGTHSVVRLLSDAQQPAPTFAPIALRPPASHAD